MAPCDRNLHDKPIVVKDSIYHKFYKYINEVKVYEQPKIGLLPLYLELYDESSPQLRTRINSFVTTICNELSKGYHRNLF